MPATMRWGFWITRFTSLYIDSSNRPAGCGDAPVSAGATKKLETQLKELTEELRGGLGGLNKLSARLDKLEGQVKELKETLRSDVKRLSMSLDGVRKYYGVQRRLIEQRLLALEAGRDGTGAGVPAGVKGRGLMSIWRD